MQKDYILEMIEELGRVLRAVINMKKSDPARALDSIRTVFTATKFETKAFFDSLTPAELETFVTEKNMSIQALDTLIDLLFEEADIRIDNGQYQEVQLLFPKIALLHKIVSQKEMEQKVHSLKRMPQKERLEYLFNSIG